MPIYYRTAGEIDKLREANKIVVAAHKRLEEILRPGITTQELDREAETVIRDMGGRPSFKGYRGFPAALCVAINDQVVHGIPDKTRVKEGDIIGLDLGAEYQGYYGDAAVTLPVGEINPRAARLLKIAREALYAGIGKVAPGGRLGDVSHAIQSHAESAGYSVVTAFVGHGIGASPHEEPQVPNFGSPGRGVRLAPGMVLAIEPMVNEGGSEVEVLEDRWTVRTVDGGLSAHFEHSVVVTEAGNEILSQGV
jgi:methionyl aminopeptidase